MTDSANGAIDVARGKNRISTVSNERKKRKNNLEIRRKNIGWGLRPPGCFFNFLLINDFDNYLLD